jgi:hypothetical protein
LGRPLKEVAAVMGVADSAASHLLRRDVTAAGRLSALAHEVAADCWLASGGGSSSCQDRPCPWLPARGQWIIRSTLLLSGC